MDLHKQVCSLELAKRLKALGVQQESVFAWLLESNGSGTLTTKDDRPPSCVARADAWCAAFTVAELGELLPESITVHGEHFHLRMTRGTRAVHQWAIGYTNYDTSWWPGLIDETHEANGRAKMLIYLLENHL